MSDTSQRSRKSSTHSVQHGIEVIRDFLSGSKRRARKSLLSMPPDSAHAEPSPKYQEVIEVIEVAPQTVGTAPAVPEKEPKVAEVAPVITPVAIEVTPPGVQVPPSVTQDKSPVAEEAPAAEPQGAGLAPEAAKDTPIVSAEITVTEPSATSPVEEKATPKSGPVMIAPYHLFCWGSLDSVTKSTAYTVVPLPDNLLASDCTFTVCARTCQDGPRCVLSIESHMFADSMIWIGTGSSNLVHAFWSDGPGRQGQTQINTERVGRDADWTRLTVVWSVSQSVLALYVDGREAWRQALSSDSLEVGREEKHVSMALGRGKEAWRRAWGWDGEISDARVWDRALDVEEIKSLELPAPVHPDYHTAWNDALA